MELNNKPFVFALNAITLLCSLQHLRSAEKVDASLRIQSAHVVRVSTELNKKFGGHYYSYSDNTPGVNLQLLLMINEATLLPLQRDAVAIETFVDDTYQSLLAGPNDYRGSPSGQTTLSDDGHALMLGVSTSRTPADEATRVFVRGSLQARISRQQVVVATNELKLNVGEAVSVGPFHVVIRSLSELGSNGGLQASLVIEGDAGRIQRIRALDDSGQALNQERENHLVFPGSADSANQALITIRRPAKDPVTLEFTYLDNIESVRIPFEAQVDIGVAKAGPLEPSEATSRRRESRAWPPAPGNTEQALPQRRAAFNPEKATPPTASAARIDKASVDLFSLTVAKPAPSEAPKAVWKNSPAASFYASGFTIARLMLSIPEACIISIPPDGVAVSRFEDDKGGKLDTALYRDSSSSGYSSLPSSLRSPDGQQMLLTVSLAASPTPGATRCTIAGDIQAKIGRGGTTNLTGNVDLRKGEAGSVGPFTVKLDTIRQVAVFQPGRSEPGGLEVWLSIDGPINKLRTVDLLDSNGKPLGGTTIAPADSSVGARQRVTCAVPIAAPLRGLVKLRLCHFESDEIVHVPFEFSAGVGL